MRQGNRLTSAGYDLGFEYRGETNASERDAEWVFTGEYSARPEPIDLSQTTGLFQCRHPLNPRRPSRRLVQPLILDKGKPVERPGRKAMGRRPSVARLPKG